MKTKNNVNTKNHSTLTFFPSSQKLQRKEGYSNEEYTIVSIRKLYFVLSLKQIKEGTLTGSKKLLSIC